MDCARYEDLRVKMFEAVKRVMLKQGEKVEEVRKTEEGKLRLMVGLIGDGETGSDAMDLRFAALVFCKRATKRRNGLVMSELDQKT